MNLGAGLLHHADELNELLACLKLHGYSFQSVTPATQARVNARPRNVRARTLPEVFGWNRPFERDVLPPDVLALARAAGACEPGPESTWRATCRIASLGQDLFVHSPFPTTSKDAVFFGPDSYRFVRAVLSTARPARRALDLGAGSGVGGICLARRGLLTEPVLLSDVNPLALGAARANARAARVRATVIESDLFASIGSEVDLVIANPPYMQDALAREYRHGGGDFGEGMSVRIVREALPRLAGNRDGGTLLLYTGAAIVRGRDTFRAASEPLLRAAGARWSYTELDPDVFGNELSERAYSEVERIAAVFLEARLGA
jgi:release factor glutamine methyltransferase